MHLDNEDSGDDERVSVQALLDAADELGIDRSEVHRAIVEEEVGLLDDRHRRGDALLGPERFVVARVVDGTAADVEARVDRWMVRGRVLRRSRTQLHASASAGGSGGGGGWSEYTRRTDPVAGAQRAMRSLQGSERLAHVRRVRVVVRTLDQNRCVVGLAVDASQSRQAATIGGTAVAVTGTGGSLVASLAASGAVLPSLLGVAAVSAASVATGAGVMWGRKLWTGSVPVELESVLDAVATGEVPPSMLDEVTARLMGPLRR